jgi:hypothetical protein
MSVFPGWRPTAAIRSHDPIGRLFDCVQGVSVIAVIQSCGGVWTLAQAMAVSIRARCSLLKDSKRESGKFKPCRIRRKAPLPTCPPGARAKIPTRFLIELRREWALIYPFHEGGT